MSSSEARIGDAISPAAVLVSQERLPGMTGVQCFAFAVIVLLGAGLRFYDLPNVGWGLYPDEAFNGYDAYCLWHTARDQNGRFLPLYTTGFEDWREALYAYLTVPLVAIFGLSEWSTRGTAALAGVATIIATFLVARKLFGTPVALLAMFLLAIYPWHVMMSRLAIRSIIQPMFFVFGLAAFLAALHKPRYFWVAAVMFAMSLYTYAAARVFVPLFLLLVLALYHRTLWQQRRYVLPAAVLFTLMVIPAVMFWFSSHGMARANVTLNLGLRQNLKWYLSYFSPSYLFWVGDPNPRHSIAQMGVLFPWDIVAVVLGLIGIALKRPPHMWLMLGWLVLYPLPAALTDPTHALRSLVGAPLFAILAAFGIWTGISWLPVRWRSKVMYGLVLLYVGGMCTFSYFYFGDYRRATRLEWDGGMRDAVKFVESSGYDSVMVSHWILGGYVHVAYYSGMDAATYQQNAILAPPFHAPERWLGRYYFTDVSKAFEPRGKSLVIVRPWRAHEVNAPGYRAVQVGEVTDGNDNPILLFLELHPEVDQDGNSS